VNLASILDGKPEGAVALVSRGKSITYGDLSDRVGRLAAAMTNELGLEPGDRVALLAANNPWFVIGYLATLAAGGVAVPLNPASPAAEIRAELTAVAARIAIVGAGGRDAMAGLGKGAVPLDHVLVTEGVELADSTRLDDLVAAVTEPATAVERDPDDLAVLIFTAGTSGSPKAAMLTHGNLLANLEQMQQHPGRRVTAEDVTLGVLPMFHIFGLNVILGLTLYAGARVILVERFDPAAALDTLKDHRVTIVAGAPPMFHGWATLPDSDPSAFNTVRLAVSGAAPLTPEVANAFERRYRQPLFQGYGLTEASPTVTSSVVGGEQDLSGNQVPSGPLSGSQGSGGPLSGKQGSIGCPLPGVEVRLVDEDGEDALHGDEGEIWVRGENVFAGYLNDEAATRAVLTDDGWLRTGDIAVADDDGYLYIVDRAKDLIIVSGFNVYPAEVEEALLEHPGINEVAVIGMSHPHTGESVRAFIVPSPGYNLEEDEVIEFCAGRLARYKCPTKITFVDELPHGVGGKLLRRELRS
jgi:long-chain acyl-CoA synthetase